METATITQQHRPGQRAWRDLSKWRLLAGLAFAPVPPIALGTFILLMLGAGMISSLLGPVLAAAEIWSMVGGTVFLLLARWGGGVRRAHCLLLGAFLAFSLPYAAWLTEAAIDWVWSADATQQAVDDDIGFGAIFLPLGLFLVPFGTLGGWVFWRIGVYPARPKVLDVAPVFD